ncbi:hypothetical protein N665_0523s0006 [Sinapis alba]|nr:hypothetical protein N665_0523s0006 [Sinapis alba]
MAMRGVDFKWYDGFFLSMLATSVIIVAINWKRYRTCQYPLHIWIVVDYTTVFIFRVLMFVDNGLAAGLGLDFGSQQRNIGFCGRVVVLSILSLLLYPFLWAWTVIGTIWFTRARSCLPEEGQKWGFLIWLVFSYSGLLCIACICVGKWVARRQVHVLRAQQGIPSSEFGILVDMIRVPDWAFEAAGQEMRGISQDAAAYHPGLYLTPAQTEAVEALIQELPKFRLKAVPDDCGECLICLEEFHIGHEVRGLPCAHNFHVECIDQWLRLNVKCPRCRCSVFPDLDLSALSNLQSSSTQQPSSQGNTETTEARYIRSQPQSESYFLRLQSLIHPVHTDTALETAENGGVPPVLAGRSPSRR